MTTKQKVGWKVLAHEKNRISCVARGNYTRKYRKGRKTIPGKAYGPLCVFTTREEAIGFITVNFSCHRFVVKCLYRPSKIDKIWTIKNYPLWLWELPTGTALADSVTCLE